MSFLDDDEEDIDNMEIEEEDWVEYIRRSTREAEVQMKTAKIPCWIETHRKMKWRMATRTASLTEERWSKKISEWNPGLDSSVKQADQWGDQEKGGKTKSMNSSRQKETEETKGNDLKTTTHGYGKQRSRKSGK